MKKTTTRSYNGGNEQEIEPTSTEARGPEYVDHAKRLRKATSYRTSFKLWQIQGTIIIGIRGILVDSTRYPSERRLFLGQSS